MTVVEQLDEILFSLAKGETVLLYMEQDETFQQAEEKDYIYKLFTSSGTMLEITERGEEVVEAGGFELWKAINKKREDEVHQATLDTTKATVDAAKSARQSRNDLIWS